MVTVIPLDWSNLPNEAAMMPFPREEVTPPVIKMYLVDEAIRNEAGVILVGLLWDSKLGKIPDLPVSFY